MPLNNELQNFKRRFHSLTGYNLELYQQVDRRLQSYLMRTTCTNFEALYEQLRDNADLQDNFMDYLNINVSEFFRNPERFRELKLKVLPELMQDKISLNFWSAGCSFGAELYSLVITLNNLKKLQSCRFMGSDIDQRALEKARVGLYRKDLLRNVSQADLNYYFDPQIQNELTNYRFKPEWKQRVSFKSHDLLQAEYPKGFDLILCRNVMIYFNKETKYQVYKKFWEALKPKGILFIGGAEQLLDIQHLGYTPLSPYFLRKNDSQNA